jgi:Holliday junction resolvasome RuvABC endonuclease subunit
MNIIGIDLAENAGVAICSYDNPYDIHCTYLKGLPHEQLNTLSHLINLNETNRNIICIEDFVYFGLNVKTSLSLVKRLGYFQYTLEALNQTVILIKPNEARKWLKNVALPEELQALKPKEQIYKLLKPIIINEQNVKITNDITDALSLLITQQKLALDKIKVQML